MPLAFEISLDINALLRPRSEGTSLQFDGIHDWVADTKA